jgi:signal transduction histidine kinase/CheY-like chemotaxis protein
VVLLIALSLTAVLVATTRAVTARSLERSISDLDAARSAFSRLVDDRADFAGAQASLVTALPVFRAHMTDSRLAADAATIETMADGYRRQLKADFAVVTNRNGVWTADPGWPPGISPSSAVVTAIARATKGTPSREIVAQQGHLYLVVFEPAQFAEESLGTLSVGYALDDRVAERLAAVAHCEVNLVADGHLYASSLATVDRAALTSLVADDQRLAAAGSGTVQQIGTGKYVLGSFPLSAAPGAGAVGRIVLLQDWRPTQRFVDEIRRRLLAAGAVIFVAAVGGSLLFSRRMSQPLYDLAAAAEDIAAGNWTRQLPVRGTTEAVVMAHAVNTMTTGLRHWYEHAKKRDDELRQAQKLEAIGRLAGGVAHDFNNLLTAIKGYGELLIEATDPGDPRTADVGEILKAADRAAALTRQLLAFSRRQVIAPRVIALDRILGSAEPMLRRLIREDVEVTTSIGVRIGLVRADPTQIEQVLLNLVVNARDAMPDGGTLRIELANVVFDDASNRHPTLPPGRYARLSVVDTGSGMTPEVASHIFEPFFTTKEEGRGTGLGLAMVYGIVEQMGGAIDVDTQLGRGTTFNLYLKQTAEAEDAVPATPSEPDPTGTRGSETVLLAEDEPLVAALIVNALRKAGYTVLEASRGEPALAIVRAHTGVIDLLLTDVVMPGMNGRELAELVKSIRPETRVLYMSGYSDDAMLRRGIETASAHFIQKPFSMDALKMKIRETLTGTVVSLP